MAESQGSCLTVPAPGVSRKSGIAGAHRACPPPVWERFLLRTMARLPSYVIGHRPDASKRKSAAGQLLNSAGHWRVRLGALDSLVRDVVRPYSLPAKCVCPEAPHREKIHKSGTGDIFNATDLSLQDNSSRVHVKKDAEKAATLTELWGWGARGPLTHCWETTGKVGCGPTRRDTQSLRSRSLA